MENLAIDRTKEFDQTAITVTEDVLKADDVSPAIIEYRILQLESEIGELKRKLKDKFGLEPDNTLIFNLNRPVAANL